MLHTSAHLPSAPEFSSQTSDADLVMYALKGHEQAFVLIMRRNNQRLFRTARSILKTDADAEDAVQDAYLKAWQALENFRADAKLSTWLVRIVSNEALARLRRKTAQIIPLDAAMNSLIPEVQQSLTENADEQPEQYAMRSELRGMMEIHIDQLPDIYRTVFVLRAVEEMGFDEVAQVLDIPEATARTRFFRARSILREGLASELDLTLSDAFMFDGERCDRIVRNVAEKAKKLGLSW